jgi:hypothetical protein
METPKINALGGPICHERVASKTQSDIFIRKLCLAIPQGLRLVFAMAHGSSSPIFSDSRANALDSLSLRLDRE